MTFTLALAVGCLLTSTLALRWLARPLVNRSWPAVAVAVLTAGALLNAGSLLLVTGMLALAVAGRWPVVATLGDWSPDALTLTIPEPVFVGLAAAAAAVLLGVRAAWRAGGLIVLLGRSDRLSRRLRSGGAPIVFVDDPTADAFTVAGVRGCVVISRSLFAALGPEERQTLVAHELSHLRRRHHLYVHAVDLAVAANPALTPLGAVVRLGVERWADEDAAAACGARATAGRALARTALVQAALRRAVDSPALTHPSSVLCATAGGVAVRAQALMNVPTPRRSRPLYFLVALLLVTGVLSLCSIVRIHDGFESAELHPDRVAENINDSRASVQVRAPASREVSHWAVSRMTSSAWVWSSDVA